MGKLPSVKRRGKGLQFSVALEGGEELLRKLQAMGKGAAGQAVEAALQHALAPVEAAIRADAPGPQIVVEPARPDPGTASPRAPALQIGPHKDAWYYQFFETGVQPFEIDMVKRRSKRSATNRRTGRRMSGRKVRGEAEVLAFNPNSGASGAVVFAKHVRRGGIPARPFMRKNFLGQTDTMEARFGEALQREVIDPHLEAQ